MEELKKLLESRPTLYLATVEGYLPRVRPTRRPTSSCWTTPTWSCAPIWANSGCCAFRAR